MAKERLRTALGQDAGGRLYGVARPEKHVTSTLIFIRLIFIRLIFIRLIFIRLIGAAAGVETPETTIGEQIANVLLGEKLRDTRPGTEHCVASSGGGIRTPDTRIMIPLL